jgi:predicted DNA-binding WGR domain protein
MKTPEQNKIKYLPSTQDAWTEAHKKAKKKTKRNSKGYSPNTPKWVMAKAAKRL